MGIECILGFIVFSSLSVDTKFGDIDLMISAIHCLIAG